MPDTDPVAAYLAEVRQRHELVTGPESGNFGRIDELHRANIQLSRVDAGVLLAALEAVRGLAADWKAVPVPGPSHYAAETIELVISAALLGEAARPRLRETGEGSG
jgi:hypothetical protein